LLVSGDGCEIEGVKVLGGTDCINITGAGTIVNKCAAGFPSVGNSGYNIEGAQTRLIDCSTVGNAATYGYKINNSNDTGVLNGCTSAGHSESGFYIDTGSSDWTILNCSSGAGDGKWRDIDNANIWSNFSYDKIKYATSTFTALGGVGGTGTKYNIFEVTGAIKLFNIFGHVTTVIPNVASEVNLELYSSNAAVDITDLSAPAPNIQNLAVGATMIKASTNDDPLLIGDNDGTPAIIEETNFRNVAIPIVLVKDDSANTYVQVNLDVALASGEIHWHVEWEPITDDGFLEPA